MEVGRVEVGKVEVGKVEVGKVEVGKVEVVIKGRESVDHEEVKTSRDIYHRLNVSQEIDLLT